MPSRGGSGVSINGAQGFRDRRAKAAIYAYVVCIVIAAAEVNDKIAQNRAIRIIDACERFRVENGAYPGEFSQLVPGYHESIPRCSWSSSPAISPMVGRGCSHVS